MARLPQVQHFDEGGGLLETLMDPTLSKTRDALLRDYAAGRVSWRELRERGFDDYIQVLGGLGELGLRPPMAPMTGPNVDARRRGRAILAKLLRGQPAP